MGRVKELDVRLERQTEENEENVSEYPENCERCGTVFHSDFFFPYQFLAKLNVSTRALSDCNSHKSLRLHC